MRGAGLEQGDRLSPQACPARLPLPSPPPPTTPLFKHPRQEVRSSVGTLLSIVGARKLLHHGKNEGIRSGEAEKEVIY
jgi:hypothetical protein